MPKIIFQPLMIANPPERLTVKALIPQKSIRPERAEAPSPGHRPGCSGWCNPPTKGKAYFFAADCKSVEPK